MPTRRRKGDASKMLDTHRSSDVGITIVIMLYGDRTGFHELRHGPSQ